MTQNPVQILEIIGVALALGGQFFVNLRQIKGYYLWIASNFALGIVSVQAGLHYMGFLYVAFFGMCVHGIYMWKRAARLEKAKLTETSITSEPAL
jgi:nicotinamide riboside transporter PnuC